VRPDPLLARRGPLTFVSMKAGLCDWCRHQKLIRNTRGSTFSMCQRSKTDERYPKYPRLPVERCAGHEPRGPAG
jgi:hypothetical protein